MEFTSKKYYNQALIILASLSFILSSPLKAQTLLEKYWRNFSAEENQDGKANFLVYPTLAFSPETSWELGLSSLYLYYANEDIKNRLSEINAFSFYTFENQYGIWLDHANYGDQDKYMVLGRLRYQVFPLFYHGIGQNTPSSPLALVDANYLLLKEHFLKQIKGYWYAGAYADLQYLASSDFNWQENEGPLPIGADGSLNFGLGLSLVYDSRHNVLNVRNGAFSELSFLQYSPSLGSEFQFNSILSDNRFYKDLGNQQVLALQALGQFINGSAPFNMLSLLGGESIMRGYYYGRYRANNLISAQAEYRILPFPFSKRWGASVFLSSGSVYQNWNDLSINKMLVAGGAGLRFLIFPKKDIYTRLDFAFTEEGPGIYFFIGEAF